MLMNLYIFGFRWLCCSKSAIGALLHRRLAQSKTRHFKEVKCKLHLGNEKYV